MKKRQFFIFITCLFTILLFLGNAPEKASAESQDINVTLLTDDYYINAAGDYTLSGANATVTIYVAGNLSGEVNITLNGVKMEHDIASNSTPLYIGSGTTVNLNLVGISRLTGSDNFSGICVPGGATLNIGGDGSLYISNRSYSPVISAPGIGGNMGADTGNITINSGYIKAIGGDYAAGIGGSKGKSGGTIIINGGKVEASGIKNGAGIGGGYQATSSTVTINGGTIVAISTGTGAAIGNGKGGAESTVTINGGNVTAYSAQSGAGIGGSTGSSAANRVIINGGIITAVSVNDSTYISYGAGIGNAYLGSGSIVEINGGIVTATGNSFAAGIGGGYQSNGCDLTIRGGTVSASGYSGIGAGNNGTLAGSCIITGGSVKYSNILLIGLNPVINYDNNGTKAYMTTLHIPGISAATDVSYRVNGGALISSTTDTSGNLYLWLKEQSDVTGSVTVNGGNSYSFSGNIQANNSNVLTATAVPTYTVTVAAVSGGSITASPASAVSGSSITLTITPDSGKQLKDGSLKYNNGIYNVILMDKSFTMPAANITISAVFEDAPPQGYLLVVGPFTGGSIYPNMPIASSGSSINLIITPDPGKQLKAGSLKYNDGTKDVTITGTSFVMPATNVTVTAEFEDTPPIVYEVMVGTLTGGSITVNLALVEEGDMVILTVTPEVGKQLREGSLKYMDGAHEVVITGTSFTMPAANITVTAEFEDISVTPTPTYAVTIGILTGGNITASPATAVSGSSITLTITPAGGKQLKAGSLKYNDGTQEVAITDTSFILPAANVTVTAEFENIPMIPVPAPTYTVTVGTLSGGSITASPATAQAGNSITLTITPDSGKQLKTGSLKYNDGTKNVAISGTSFILPDANVTITAEYEDIPMPSTDTNLISIGTPTAITGLMNGTAKSAAALELPATVSIITSGGGKSASVVWNVASCTYNQFSLSAQSFIVIGSLTLPSGVVNTNNVNLSVTISVSVNQGTAPDSGPGVNSNDGSEIVGNNPATNTDTKLPSIEGSEAKGWDSVTQYITDNNTGSITVAMNGDTTVTQEIFEAVKGKDIDLTFDLGNGIEWIINGTDIPEGTEASQLHGIDLNLSMNTDSIPAELLDTLPETEQVQISLAYDGSFGFTATLRLPVEEKYSGKFANLFYYNPVTNQLELQAVGEVDKNGNVEFPFTHASDYVIVMRNSSMLNDAIDQITVAPVKKTLYVGGTKGHSVTLKTIIPETVQKAVSDGLCEMSIIYHSSNPKVAIVSDSGKIVAKKTGTITITTTIMINGVEKNFQTIIKVKKAYIKFSKSTKTMKLGETDTFQVAGYGIDEDDIVFTTSQKSIVKINKLSGEAIAKSAGNDYVIAKSGDIEVKIKVSVQ